MSREARPNLYRRIDLGLARIEGAVAVFVLIAMVLVASAQALFFNIAEKNVAWAQSMLDSLSWADTFLQKGTLWLAFVGASLATQQNKHIAIDVVPRFAPRRISQGMRCFASLGSAVIALILAAVFYQACLVADAAVPFEYEIITQQGPTHVCDASAEELGETGSPTALCAMRAALATLGVPVTSGGGVAQLIVPAMFVLIALRLFARTVITGHALITNALPEDDEERQSEVPPLLDDELTHLGEEASQNVALDTTAEEDDPSSTRDQDSGSAGSQEDDASARDAAEPDDPKPASEPKQSEEESSDDSTETKSQPSEDADASDGEDDGSKSS